MPKETYNTAKETCNTAKETRNTAGEGNPQGISQHGNPDWHAKRDLQYAKRDLRYAKRDLQYGKRAAGSVLCAEESGGEEGGGKGGGEGGGGHANSPGARRRRKRLFSKIPKWIRKEGLPVGGWRGEGGGIEEGRALVEKVGGVQGLQGMQGMQGMQGLGAELVSRRLEMFWEEVSLSLPPPPQDGRAPA